MTQVPTRPATVAMIMRAPAFARGVADMRAGRQPRFDVEDSWEYERGRQWAVAAPPLMPLRIGRKINPQAITVFEKALIP